MSENIFVICNDCVNISIYDNQSQYTFHIPNSKKIDSTKIIESCIEYIFKIKNMYKPNVLCNKKKLVDSLQIYDNLIPYNNQINISLNAKPSCNIYKLKIIGINISDPIYYIGTSLETFGDVIKIIKKNNNNKIDKNSIFLFNDKELIHNNRLSDCKFNSHSQNTINDIIFKQNNTEAQVQVTKTIKDKILLSQNGKCANSPCSKIRGLGGFECLLYKNNGDGKIPLKSNGEVNGECDHIKPRAIGGTNDEWNLQYLCQFCHAQKTVSDNDEIKFFKNMCKNTNCLNISSDMSD